MEIILKYILEGLGNCVKHNSKHNPGKGRNCSRLVHLNKKLKKCSECSFCSGIVPELFLEQFPMRRPCTKHNFVCMQLHRLAPRCMFYGFGVCIFVLRQVNLASQSYHNFPSTATAEQLEQFDKIVPLNNFPNLLIHVRKKAVRSAHGVKSYGDHVDTFFSNGIMETRGLRSLHFAKTYNSCQCSNNNSFLLERLN